MSTVSIIAPLSVIIVVAGVLVWGFWFTRLEGDPSAHPEPSVLDAEDRAEKFLRSVVSLTGATQLARYYYLLDVGTARFEVHDSYVSRIPLPRAPKGAPKGTCFYIPDQHMPVSEKIATALLQLKTNPALFESWASQNGVYKPDGELFKS